MKEAKQLAANFSGDFGALTDFAKRCAHLPDVEKTAITSVLFA
jgi:hypothetical protein